MSGIVGVTDGSNAAPGMVGEYLSVDVQTGLALTSTVIRDIATLGLTAGDWDVWADFSILPTGGTVTALRGWLSTISATYPVLSNQNGAQLWWQVVPASTINFILPGLRMRVSLSAPGTVYLSVVSTFTGGPAQSYGFIGARRMR
jgi:hypothetical protein